MPDYLKEISLIQVEQLGKCLGIMSSLLKYGNLSNFDFKNLAEVYLEVIKDKYYFEIDKEFILGEAKKREIIVNFKEN